MILKKLKIGLDYHGIVDKYPSTFSDLTQHIIKNSWEIHIITGHEDTPQFRKKLDDMGIHFTHIFSIVSYHQSIGTKIKYDEKGNPWIDQELWDRSKADYCEREKIDFIIDDSEIYGKYFENIKTIYLKF